MSDDDILVRLTSNTENFKSGIDDASNSLLGFLKHVAGAPVTWASFAVAATAAGTALFGLATMASNYGEELEKMSKQTGLSVEELSLLKFAAEQSETSLESLSSGVKFMQRNLTDAVSGNEKAETSFRALGLSAKEMSLMSTNEQLLAMADALADVQDPAIRTKLAMDIMGRGAIEMMPLLVEGAEGIRKLTGEAEALGLKMSTETAKQADQFNDTLHKLWAVIKQLGIDIGVILLPPLTVLFDILTRVTGLLKNAFFAAIHSVNGMILSLTSALLVLIEGFSWFTDTMGLTNGMQQKIAAWQKTVNDMMIEAGRSAAESMTKAADSVTRVAHAEEDLSGKKKVNIDLTDAQRLAILGEKDAQEKAAKAAKAAEEAYKAELEVNKKFNEGVIQDINNIVETKKALKQFDDAYFEAYAMKLGEQGKTQTQITELLLLEHKRVADAEIKDADDSVNRELERLVKIGAVNQDYFDLYAYKLRSMGATEEQIARDVLKERIRLRNEDKANLININEVEKTAIKGLADSIKLLWGDTTVSFKDAWQGALNNFIDTLSQMYTNALVTYNSMTSAAELSAEESQLAWEEASAGISVATAAATAGISLLIGLIAATFTGGKGGRKTEIEQATNAFLSRLSSTLSSFKDQILNTMEKLTDSFDSGSAAMTRLVDLATYLRNVLANPDSHIISKLEDIVGGIVQNLDEVMSAVTARYSLEKSLINDVIGLLKSQKGLVADFDKSIREVTRSTFTKEQILGAEKSDIQDLLTRITGSSGQDRVDLANELKTAYLDYFNTAKEIYSGADLAAIQQEVVSGLEAAKGYGVSGFDQLININLDMLGVQREGVDLTKQMVALQGKLDQALFSVLSSLKLIAQQPLSVLDPATMNALLGGLETLGFSVPKMATGGIVTQRTLAIIGESGPEAVVPLNRGGGMGNVTITGGLNISIPNVKDIRDMTQRDWEQALKKARFAAERLGRDGFGWGMA